MRVPEHEGCVVLCWWCEAVLPSLHACSCSLAGLHLWKHMRLKRKKVTLTASVNWYVSEI